jgi:glycosyltransferase involved in cell wall biosynthesis
VDEAMQLKPMVSIVIPTRNRCDILRRCLDALVRQTYPNFEIVVVNDASSDGTPVFLKEFADRHVHLAFRAIRNERHLGANPSRNRGIHAAKGVFVAFLDNDCIAEPEWLDRLMRGFTGERVAAVTGMVVDPPPNNIYELTFKGTHRVHRAGWAPRLIAGNMCVRRELLLKYRLDEDRSEPLKEKTGRPDVTISGRGDEEGLFLVLRAAGYEMRSMPDAVVLHEHPLDRRSFFRQAFRGGRSAARLVYKYHLPQRLDMLPFMLTYLTVPLMLIDLRAAALPLFFLVGALSAITYNDLFRKGKSIGETLRSFPMLLLYYHVRLGGYVAESFRLRLVKHGIKRFRLSRYRTEGAAEAEVR